MAELPHVLAEEAAGPSAAAGQAGGDFVATHEPVMATQHRGPVDVQETFVRPLQALIGGLGFSLDENLSEFGRRHIRTKLADFRRGVMDALGHIGNPGEWREFIDFCQAELGFLQALGLRAPNFSEVLALLSDAQIAWSEDEAETRPRPPVAQIAALEKSSEESRKKVAHIRLAIAAGEGRLGSFAREEASVRAELAAREAQLSELEMSIRSLKERLSSVCAARERTSTRVEDSREEVAHEERALENAAAEIQALRLTTIEASPEALERYARTSELMRAVQRDLRARLDQLDDP